MNRRLPFGWLRRYRYRYRAVIIGTESGNRTPIDFVRFRTERQAVMWCVNMTNMEREADNPLTHWHYEVIP